MNISASALGHFLRTVACLLATAGAPAVFAVDRTTMFVPLATAAKTTLPDNAIFPDQAPGIATVDGWSAYMRLWKAHHDDPTNVAVRRYLGLPLKGVATIKQRPGRSAPKWLAWRGGSYQQFDTPHFVVYSRAGITESRHVVEDLERCYWIWTQMFFPLWEANKQVAANLDALSEDTAVADFLSSHAARLGNRTRLRIVIFRGADEYRQTIKVPGIERSTGFYSDEKKTTFLYAATTDDAATRRHELVHQMFREATDSGLRRRMPGEEADFWLIEGIAGYFESLHVGDGWATVGGWDSPRLQFARYRHFAAGDRMPIEQLRADGRLSAQQRPDLARWYAHAITQTHKMMDGDNRSERHWVYQKLADLYHIDTNLDDAETNMSDQKSVLDFLSVDDEHISTNRAHRKLEHLCLAGCPVTPAGLQHIPPAPDLRRVTLNGRPIDVDSIVRLVAQPQSIEQLSLERTGIDNSIGKFLGKAPNLRELDLSSTAIDDTVVHAIRNANQLTTLWLTGTKITKNSVPVLLGLPSLKNVDLQRTGMTADAFDQLKKAKPNWNINPLKIQELPGG